MRENLLARFGYVRLASHGLELTLDGRVVPLGAPLAEGEKDAKLALEYVNLLMCAVPDVVKMAKKIAKAPDTQPVVSTEWVSERPTVVVSPAFSSTSAEAISYSGPRVAQTL